MKKMITLFAVLGMVLALAPAAQAVTPLTGANVTYSGQTITSIKGLNFNITAPSSLVMTWAGATSGNTLYIKNGTTTIALYDQNDANLDTFAIGDTLHSSHAAFLTDSSIGTGWSFNSTTAPHTLNVNLATSMTPSTADQLNEVALILFESNGNDYPTIRAYDGTTAIGTERTLIAGNWGDTGAASGTFANQVAAAVGISLGDLGVTTGQTVTKFVITNTGNWDPLQIMVDSNLSPPPVPAGTVIRFR